MQIYSTKKAPKRSFDYSWQSTARTKLPNWQIRFLPRTESGLPSS